MLNTHICDTAYFKYLVSYMKRLDVLSAWYDYLMSLDVSKHLILEKIDLIQRFIVI